MPRGDVRGESGHDRPAGENRTRDEDAIIAYTWDRYLRTGDERWPARLPMTKAAVRAMDAVTAYRPGDFERPAALCARRLQAWH